MREVLAKIKADGTPIQAMERLLPLGDFIDLIGLPEIREIEERLSDEKARLPR
jgi:hypothetical protein